MVTLCAFKVFIMQSQGQSSFFIKKTSFSGVTWLFDVITWCWDGVTWLIRFRKSAIIGSASFWVDFWSSPENRARTNFILKLYISMSHTVWLIPYESYGMSHKLTLKLLFTYIELILEVRIFEFLFWSNSGSDE